MHFILLCVCVCNKVLLKYNGDRESFWLYSYYDYINSTSGHQVGDLCPKMFWELNVGVWCGFYWHLPRGFPSPAQDIHCPGVVSWLLPVHSCPFPREFSAKQGPWVRKGNGRWSRRPCPLSLEGPAGPLPMAFWATPTCILSALSCFPPSPSLESLLSKLLSWESPSQCHFKRT